MVGEGVFESREVIDGVCNEKMVVLSEILLVESIFRFFLLFPGSTGDCSMATQVE